MKHYDKRMTDAICAGNMEEVKNLIKEGSSIDESSVLKEIEMDGKRIPFMTTPIELAFSEGQYDMVRLFVDSGAKLPRENSYLIRAIRHNRPDLFAYMVEHGAALNKKKMDVVQLLANLADCWDNAYIPLVAALKLPIKRYGSEGLYRAAEENQIEMAKWLISLGVDVNTGESFAGATPALGAAVNNHFEMLRFLVEHGADLSIADRYGERPYTAAKKNHNTEMTAYIKDREPEELHSEAAQAARFAACHVPKEMEEYLKTGNLLLSLSEDSGIKWLKLNAYLDVPEITYKNKKLLSLVEDSDDGDIVLGWEPKSQSIWFVDSEEDALRKVGTWEEFIHNPEGCLDRVIVWASE